MLAKRTRFRSDIQGLRGFALVLNTLFHFFGELLPGCYIGPDIFFVISGFLITLNISEELSRGEFSLRLFYWKRIRRILPTLILTLTIGWVVGWFLFFPLEFVRYGEHLKSAATFLSNLQLYREGSYFDSPAEFKPLLHMWTLAVEEQFYLIWPLLFTCLFKWTKFRSLPLTGLILGSIFLNLYFQSDTSFCYYDLGCRSYEFLAGAMLGTLFSKPSRWPNALAWVGLFLFGFAVSQGNSGNQFLISSLTVLGTLLLLSAEDSWVNRRFMRNPFFLRIGVVSYPLYLWLSMFLTFAKVYVAGQLSLPIAISVLAVSYGLAELTHRKLEVPCLKLSPSRVALVGCLSSLALLYLLGTITLQMNGFPSRIDPDALKRASFIDPHWFGPTKSTLGQCHLIGPAEHDYPSSCAGNHRPLVWLWGDSLANSLRPGLEALAKLRGHELAQTTKAGCQPLLHTTQGVDCLRANQSALELMKQHRPEMIFIAGLWPAGQNTAPSILNTVAELRREFPWVKIILTGPWPVWNYELPLLQARESRPYSKHAAEYSRFGLKPLRIELERVLQDSAKAQGITYVSPIQILCRGDECLVRTPDTDDLAFTDSFHLSASASRFLATKIASILVKDAEPGSQ